MTIADQIKDEKLQYDINREAAKISALSSGKIDKKYYYWYIQLILWILPSNQKQIIEQPKLLTLLWKKLLKNKQKKQVKTIKDLSIFDKTNELK